MIVDQTTEEETWPGGALWDIGVLLSKLLVAISSSSSCSEKDVPSTKRLKSCGIISPRWKNSSILELGCGVGLTGLVGAALGAKLTMLTDLSVVVEKVTRPNLEKNKSSFRSGQKIMALPLCWGDEEDENNYSMIMKREMPRKNTLNSS